MSDTQPDGAATLLESATPAKKPRAAKKAATPKTTPAKKAAKKTAAKKAVKAKTEAPLTPPPPPAIVEPAPVAVEGDAKPTAKKVVRKKVAKPVAEAPAPVAESAPAQETKSEAPETASVSAEASPANKSGESAPPTHPPRHFPQGPAPQGQQGGPPGDRPYLSRKARRWEKFKRKKQLQREAAAAAAAGQPLPEGAASTGGEVSQGPAEGENGHKPWQRDKFQRFPRPPKPEPVLGPPEDTAGLLEISPKGFGFLRLREKNYVQSPTDTFVTPEMVRKYGLRDGVWIEGEVRRGHRGPQLTELKKVNGFPPDQYRQLPIFEELTAINPNKRYVLETEGKRYTTRLVDMVAPIGRGQRGLIVAAPRAGKTTFLEHMAQAILHNYENVKLLVVLVDERPEEVTELTRALPGAEVMACSNDQDPRNHIRMAELAIERAKRLVEAGEHVFMLMDSITRLARAFNNVIRGGGKAMSGGIDSRALEMPRKIFAAARNTREAGSLTIIATALIDTNQKGDDLIFQEFKGTGNMELVLDRKIAQQYIYPAVDIFKSGTRREELLLPPYQLEKINVIRRGLAGHKPAEAMERMIHFLDRFRSNAELLTNIATSKG